jgi:hypothetical protein
MNFFEITNFCLKSNRKKADMILIKDNFEGTFILACVKSLFIEILILLFCPSTKKSFILAIGGILVLL